MAILGVVSLAKTPSKIGSRTAFSNYKVWGGNALSPNFN